jgi:hypothetical protein
VAREVNERRRRSKDGDGSNRRNFRHETDYKLAAREMNGRRRRSKDGDGSNRRNFHHEADYKLAAATHIKGSIL